MKLIEIGNSRISLDELLEMACKETVILRKPDSNDFVLTTVDEFDLEVELLRNNREFMTYLEELSNKKATISIDDVEKKLNLYDL